ncbi:hypothetical protein [Streptomyces salinarius]|uniref:Integral membrane protein n=1 Tax=Streptomyces salinarius TaxID=2762598 RepID=A0ABW8BPN9_9ACTN
MTNGAAAGSGRHRGAVEVGEAGCPVLDVEGVEVPDQVPDVRESVAVPPGGSVDAGEQQAIAVAGVLVSGAAANLLAVRAHVYPSQPFRGTGNKIVGHAGLRSATGVVAGVAAVSATVGGGLVYAGMKLKSHLDDRKAEHDEAPAGAAGQTAASADVVEVEETAVTETRRLRAV